MTYADSNRDFTEKIERMKSNFPTQIIRSRIFWECEVDALLKTKENEKFYNEIYPNLTYFKRLKPRDSLCSGIRQLYCLKWSKDENPGKKLQFLDINSAYVFVASTLQFPIGPLEILIHDDVENYVYKNGVLMQKDTNKVIDAGLIKLLVLPNQNQEPLFVVKGKDPKTKKQRTYQPLCCKCLRLQKKIPCTHSEKERAIEVTTTVDFLLWALSIKNVTIFKILEVWSFKEKAYVMKKFLELMIDFKDKQEKPIKKLINKSLQCCFGKLSMKPFKNTQKLCTSFEELNEVLCHQSVSDIGKKKLLLAFKKLCALAHLT